MITKSIPPICNEADPRAPGAADLSWWLGCVHVGHEVSIATEMFDAFARVLLPMCEYQRSTPSGKKRRTRKAIFDGYLFVCGDEIDRLDALSACPGRIHTIPIAEGAVPGLVADLSRLMDAIDAGQVIGPSRPTLKMGDPVRVVDGLFEGKAGKYLRGGPHETAWIEVACLGRAVPVCVDAWQVEHAEPMRMRA